MRSFIFAAALLGAATALPAQQSVPGDPDKPAAGGQLPSGWLARLDRPTAKIEDVKFVTMGDGFHVTTGPATILYDSSAHASGDYTVSATFTQTRAPRHPEAYGIFIGGAELEGAGQSYMYFLARGDGKVIVLHRAGADVHRIMEWTENAAAVKADSNGKATNTLTASVASDSVRFLVNGAPVMAISRERFGSAAGTYGLRINHNLDVHVADLKYTPAAP